MAKRYVLLASDSDLPADFVQGLGGPVSERFPKSKLIQLKDSPKFLVVKTDVEGSARLRKEGLSSDGVSLRAVLTSGNIGKLKRRALGARATSNGEIPQ